MLQLLEKCYTDVTWSVFRIFRCYKEIQKRYMENDM